MIISLPLGLRTLIRQIIPAFITFFLIMPVFADNDKMANSFYEDAVTQFNEQKYEAAIIQLKNALQKNPRLLPALVLLGQAHLKAGNYAAAETTLKDAGELGADPSLLAIPLAKSYMAQFKHDIFLAQSLPKLPKKILAELLVLRAQAALEIGNDKAFLDALSEAENIDPNAAELLATKATRAMQLGELAEAEKIIDRLLDLYPRSPDSWIAQASLKQLQGDAESALKNYDLALSLDPERSEARIAKVSLLLDLGRDNETTPELKKLSETRNSDPRVSYLRSIKLARAGDEHGSRDALNRALNVIEVMGPDIVDRNQQLILISAIANLNLGNKDFALHNFEKYVKMGGNEVGPLISLAKLYVGRGDYLNATDILEKLMEQIRFTPDLISLLTEAYHGAGQHQKAVNLLEYATSNAYDSPKLNTRLAISRLQAGYIDRGMQDLEKIFNKTETKELAGLPLVLMYLNRGDFNHAHQASEQLLKLEPENLTYISLLAISKVSLGDLKLARQLFEKLLTNDASRTTAEINLAKINTLEHNFTEAKSLLSAVLIREPKNSQAMLEMSRISMRENNTRDALKWATDATAANPESFNTKRYLIELLIQTGELAEAAKYATEQAEKYQHNLYVLETQLKVLIAQNETKQALGLLSKMASLAASNPDWLLRIARYQIALDAQEQASYALFKALQSNPMHSESRVLLTETQLSLGRIDEAMDNAKFLVNKFPQMSIGFRLLGDLMMQQKKYPEAEQQYKKALSRQSLSELTLRLHIAQRRAKELNSAETTLTSWLSNNPEDLLIKNALAEFYVAQNKYTDAAKVYSQLIALQPQNPYLHNNLANTLLYLEKHNEAMASARRAYEILPKNPSINDTLGWLLILSGDFEQGLSYLREALTRAADNAEIRYHIAVALHRLGRDQEALLELNRILKRPQNFNGRKEAEALKIQLDG